MDVSDEIEERLLAIVSREGLIDRSRLSRDATLESLGIASADVIVILMAVKNSVPTSRSTFHFRMRGRWETSWPPCGRTW